jgi:hypothetical protein
MLSSLLDTCGRKAVGDEIGVDQPAISKWADPSEDNGRRMPAPTLDLVCRLFPCGAAVVARHYAALAGGAFVPLASGATLSPHGALAELGLRVADTAADLLYATDPAGPHGTDLSPCEIAGALAKVAAVSDAVAALTAALVAAQDGGRK